MKVDTHRHSFDRNRYGIALMILSSLAVCIGQLLWKIGTDGNFLLIGVGFLAYGIGSLFMIMAYKHGSLSVLQPFLSLNCVFSCVLGIFVLNEYLSVVNIVGIFTIMLGVILISVGD